MQTNIRTIANDAVTLVTVTKASNKIEEWTYFKYNLTTQIKHTDERKRSEHVFVKGLVAVK